MMKNGITVIGSGATALAVTAYLTLKGYQIILCDTKESHNLSDIRETGGITLTGAMETTKPVSPYLITSDFKAALEHNCRILICISADRHEEIAELCRPYAKDGQTYMISPGNLGSIICVDKFRQEGQTDITVAEVVGNICPCRIIAKSRVMVALPISSKKIAAFPANRTQRAIQEFCEVFNFTAVKNIFEGILNSPNLVMHLAGTLLNTTMIEKMGENFALYLDGLTPSLLTCVEAVEAERNQVLDALGYNSYGSEVSKMHRMMNYGSYDELNDFRSLKGPASLKDRYISEDASCSVALLISIAKEYAIQVPVCSALLTIASTLNSFDYYENGRTLRNLGISGLSKEEINLYLENLSVAGR